MLVSSNMKLICLSLYHAHNMLFFLILNLDIVVWDSHPLALGATPQQVYVDGIPQLHNPAVSLKPHTSQSLPTPPNFDAEAVAVVRYSGLPPLEPRKLNRRGPVMFTNVNSVFSRMGDGAITHRDHAGVTAEWESVVVHDGEVVCSGSGSSCRGLSGDDDNAEVIDLQGGSLVPGLIAYGSPLGLLEMRLEPSTTDGIVPNPLDVNSASILGAHPLIRAVDGLQFGGRNTLSVSVAQTTRRQHLLMSILFILDWLIAVA